MNRRAVLVDEVAPPLALSAEIVAREQLRDYGGVEGRVLGDLVKIDNGLNGANASPKSYLTDPADEAEGAL